ncbi:MAG: choice-of-anchor D domain-containing protein [Pseudomonadota bacterium]
MGQYAVLFSNAERRCWVKTAIALSGGGARGAFQVGAVKCLYTAFGIRPDLLTSTGMGSVNAAKLAEGRTADEQRQAVRELEHIWSRLQAWEDLFQPQPWLVGLLQAAGGPEGLFGTAAGEDALDHPAATMLLATLQHGGALAKAAKGAQEAALFTLAPLAALLRERANLDPARVAQGTELRMAVTSLASGTLRWAAGDGRLLEGDNVTGVASAAPDAVARCQAAAAAYGALQEEIGTRLEARRAAKPAKRKAELTREIRALQMQAGQAWDALQSCLAEGATAAARVDLVAAVLAAAAAPGLLPPVALGLESYVGAVATDVPVRLALQMGAGEVYAIDASSRREPPPAVPQGLADVLAQALRRPGSQMEDGAHGTANWQDAAVHVIAPSFDVHGTMQIDPGLIAINMDYGFMRAGDVLSRVAGFDRARAIALSDAITRLRRDTWELELDFAAAAAPAYRRQQHALLREIRLRKWVLGHLVAARQALAAPVPAEAVQWSGRWERHLPDQLTALSTPWAALAGAAESTPADSPAGFVPDGWLLRESGGETRVLLRGALFPVPDEAALRDIGYAAARVVELPAGALTALPRVPQGELLLQEAGSDQVWYCNGARRHPVERPAVRAALGMEQAAVQVLPRGALAQIPDGGPIDWIGGLAVTDGALNALREYTPVPQLEESDTVHECCLHNQGKLPVTVTAVRVEGAAQSAFELLTDLPFTLAPGAREALRLRFRAARAGPVEGTLVVESDDALFPHISLPLRTAVRALGPRGKLRIVTPSLAFTDSIVGQQRTRTITLENVGNQTAQLVELRLTEEMPAGQFALPAEPLSDVPAGQSRDLAVTHAPDRRGDASAVVLLKVQGDATYFEEHSVVLRAEGVTSPRIALEPAQLDFGAITPGITKNHSFAIANKGDAPLTVHAIAGEGGKQSFRLDPPLDLPITVAPGTATMLQVLYHNPAPGQADSEALLIVSDDPEHPQIRLHLQGATGNPRIHFPDFINFHRVRRVPAQAEVMLRNIGSGDLVVKEISLESGADFSLLGISRLPMTIAAGAEHVFKVQFNAGMPGRRYRDRIIVRSNGAFQGSPVKIGVQAMLV